jgi:hypothetical protein
MAEDDYLSDKFLINADAQSNVPKTYAQLRKERQKEAKLKNERNKLKSRRQLELESREEGLSKSLFERAKEEEESGIGRKSKALNIMMKMGFKPGQALGSTSQSDAEPTQEEQQVSAAVEIGKAKLHHKIEPLPINEEWTGAFCYHAFSPYLKTLLSPGKKGIGLGKRASSPTSVERVVKMAKMLETSRHDTFRDRSRQEYEERRAEGRLHAAQRTCITLDEKAGKSVRFVGLLQVNC